MITASCLFCEDVRAEANGQESWIGVFDAPMVKLNGNVTGRLLAMVTIHVPFEDDTKTFGIRVVDDLGRDHFSSPPAEIVADGVDRARKGGLSSACFPASIDLGAALGLEASSVRVLLSVEGEEALIGTFTIARPEETGD